MLQTNENSIIDLWERLREKCSNSLSYSYKLRQLTSEIQNFSYNHKQKNKNGFFSGYSALCPTFLALVHFFDGISNCGNKIT